ncbi:hypothetical protein GY45DRAFT_1081955 [Cubamyces sp. BRFM 1775]|nr:hypothetical protein GY45DRAFT_1081955 [Cubamyces sp. BRFM 1775]
MSSRGDRPGKAVHSDPPRRPGDLQLRPLNLRSHLRRVVRSGSTRWRRWRRPRKYIYAASCVAEPSTIRLRGSRPPLRSPRLLPHTSPAAVPTACLHSVASFKIGPVMNLVLRFWRGRSSTRYALFSTSADADFQLQQFAGGRSRSVVLGWPRCSLNEPCQASRRLTPSCWANVHRHLHGLVLYLHNQTARNFNALAAHLRPSLLLSYVPKWMSTAL